MKRLNFTTPTPSKVRGPVPLPGITPERRRKSVPLPTAFEEYSDLIQAWIYQLVHIRWTLDALDDECLDVIDPEHVELLFSSVMELSDDASVTAEQLADVESRVLRYTAEDRGER